MLSEPNDLLGWISGVQYCSRVISARAIKVIITTDRRSARLRDDEIASLQLITQRVLNRQQTLIKLERCVYKGLTALSSPFYDKKRKTAWRYRTFLTHLNIIIVWRFKIAINFNFLLWARITFFARLVVIHGFNFFIILVLVFIRIVFHILFNHVQFSL